MKSIACLTALVMLAGCTRATPEAQTIEAAAEALGGAGRLQAVRTLVLEGEGVQGNLGQDMRPDVYSQTFTVSQFRRAIDLEAARARTELTRTPDFVFFQGQAAQRQVQGVDGDVGYNVAANGNASRVADGVARERRLDRLHHPVTAVRAALRENAALTNRRSDNGQTLVDVTTADGAAFTLAVDASTQLPIRVISTAYNANLGDVLVETTFGDYQDVDGLRLPARLTTRTDTVMTSDIHVTSHGVNGETGDLAAPSAAASAAPVAPPSATVVVQDLAPGLWLLAGQGHHSVVVEFEDHLTLIEAPQSETRTLAVIARARELRPEKPLTRVVNTHHHFDHSAGIRAAMSEGLTVTAHQSSVAFFEDLAKRPHTLQPDALARAPRAATVEGVVDRRVISDGRQEMQLYAVEGSPHADTLLVVYFPRHRMLVQADMFTPGSAVTPYAPNLLDTIERRRLRVDRLIPLHGAEAPYAGFVKAAQAGRTAAN